MLCCEGVKPTFENASSTAQNFPFSCMIQMTLLYIAECSDSLLVLCTWMECLEQKQCVVVRQWNAHFQSSVNLEPPFYLVSRNDMYYSCCYYCHVMVHDAWYVLIWESVTNICESYLQSNAMKKVLFTSDSG